MILTDEQHKTISGRLRGAFSLNPEKAHARHDGADEVDIKNRQNIYEMESHSDGQEAKTRYARHACGSFQKTVEKGEKGGPVRVVEEQSKERTGRNGRDGSGDGDVVSGTVH